MNSSIKKNKSEIEIDIFNSNIENKIDFQYEKFDEIHQEFEYFSSQNKNSFLFSPEREINSEIEYDQYNDFNNYESKFDFHISFEDNKTIFSEEGANSPINENFNNQNNQITCDIDSLTNENINLCEICFRDINIVSNFEKIGSNGYLFNCYICKIKVHYRCLELFYEDNYISKLQNSQQKCFKCLDQSNLNICEICQKHEGFLLVSSNNKYSHPICLYSGISDKISEIILKGGNNFAFAHLKNQNKNRKCQYCNKNNGIFVKNENYHAYCGLINYHNLIFMYKDYRLLEYSNSIVKILNSMDIIYKSFDLIDIKVYFSDNSINLKNREKDNQYNIIKNNQFVVNLNLINSKKFKLDKKNINSIRNRIHIRKDDKSLIDSKLHNFKKLNINYNNNFDNKNNESISNRLSLITSFDFLPVYNFLSNKRKLNYSNHSPTSDNENNISIYKNPKISKYFVDESNLFGMSIKSLNNNSKNTIQNLINELKCEEEIKIKIFEKIFSVSIKNKNKINSILKKLENERISNFEFSTKVEILSDIRKKHSLYEKFRSKLKKGIEIYDINFIIKNKIDACDSFLLKMNDKEKLQFLLTLDPNCSICFSDILPDEISVFCNNCKILFHKDCDLFSNNFNEEMIFCDSCKYEKSILLYYYSKEIIFLPKDFLINEYQKLKFFGFDFECDVLSEIIENNKKCIFCLQSIGLLKFFILKGSIVWFHLSCIFLSNKYITFDLTLNLNKIITNTILIDLNSKSLESCELCKLNYGEIIELNDFENEIKKDKKVHFMCAYLNGFKMKLNNNNFMNNELKVFFDFKETANVKIILDKINELNFISIIRKNLCFRKNPFEIYLKKEFYYTIYNNEKSSTKFKISFYQIDEKEDIKNTGKVILTDKIKNKFDFKNFKNYCYLCFINIEPNEIIFKCGLCKESAHKKCILFESSIESLDNNNKFCQFCTYLNQNKSSYLNLKQLNEDNSFETVSSKQLKLNKDLIPKCNICLLQNVSIGSLLRSNDNTWIHRECKEFYISIPKNRILYKDIKSKDNKEVECELCWANIGNMLKCVVSECNIMTHILCGKISGRIFKFNNFPVSYII